ncbi:beta-galactosidase [Paenibacillus sp. yr247]|uniref:hypothetical protein n=1 Tax=Paenibacillus sp. yr247 TaxID=1761880 RepID=UPI0008869857|nr:hypothetical protein [Paenibacillus sp. yr247]SDP13097.1 beta-galactosidase [Paenibacillus sp. yr247]
MNHVIAVAKGEGNSVVQDDTTFHYQTESWGAPAFLRLTSHISPDASVYVEVLAYDKWGVFCQDAATLVHFGLAGTGKLLDNLGTVRGARTLELANGRARIYVDPRGGTSIVSVHAEGLDTTFVKVSSLNEQTTDKE